MSKKNLPSLDQCRKEFFECVQELALINFFGYCMFFECRVEFNDSIPTAVVRTEFMPTKEGLVGAKPTFEFNREFWSKLSHEERLFLMLHEVRHVESSHGLRIVQAVGGDPTSREARIANIAADFAVNAGLLKDYNFVVDELPILREIGAWADLHQPPLDENLSFEEYFYYLLAKYNSEQDLTQKGLDTIEDHSDSPEETENAAKEAVSESLDRALESLTEDQLKDLQKKLDPSSDPDNKNEQKLFKEKLREQIQNEIKGQSPDMQDLIQEAVSAVKKSRRPWTVFARRFTKRVVRENHQDTWYPDRRTMLTLPGNLRMPSEHIREEHELIDLLVFLDTSGSCRTLVPHFMGLLEAIPRDVFRVHPYGFTTSVYKIDEKNPRLRNGGTIFRQIGTTVNEHPNCYVFVFTDGDGTECDQQNPRRWHWFGYITRPGWTSRFISPNANVHDIQDFE